MQHGVGNIVIEAAAGSGKTSTLIKALKLIPSDKKILFCAFNKDIVKELQKKIGKDERAKISSSAQMPNFLFPFQEKSSNMNNYIIYVL